MNPKQRVGLVIIGLTSVLVVGKVTVWLITDSIAVQSEAFNSSVDLIYSIIIITGFLLSQREKTSEYPEGLIRLEPLVSLIVSGVIITTGLIVAYTGIQQLIHGQSPTQQPYIAVGILLFSALVKFALYKYVSQKAEQYQSVSLAATAVDTRNDILTSGLALLGVVAFILGYPVIEPIIAICISLYIIYSGIRVAEENFKYALGRSVSPETKTAICDAAMSHPEVRGLHDVEIHYTGPLLDVSLHAEIDGGISIEQGHTIEYAVADEIRGQTEAEVNEINIHLDPESLDEWKTTDSY